MRASGDKMKCKLPEAESAKGCVYFKIVHKCTGFKEEEGIVLLFSEETNWITHLNLIRSEELWQSSINCVWERR